MSNATVFRCMSLIANSIAKMELRLVRETESGVWAEVMTQNPFAAVLRQPNEYQNHIQFIQQWVSSLQIWGNTYALEAARRAQRRRGASLARSAADSPDGRRPMARCSINSVATTSRTRPNR